MHAACNLTRLHFVHHDRSVLVKAAANHKAERLVRLRQPNLAHCERVKPRHANVRSHDTHGKTMMDD